MAGESTRATAAPEHLGKAEFSIVVTQPPPGISQPASRGLDAVFVAGCETTTK
jgi:hypothetical protein